MPSGELSGGWTRVAPTIFRSRRGWHRRFSAVGVATRVPPCAVNRNSSVFCLSSLAALICCLAALEPQDRRRRTWPGGVLTAFGQLALPQETHAPQSQQRPIQLQPRILRRVAAQLAPTERLFERAEEKFDFPTSTVNHGCLPVAQLRLVQIRHQVDRMLTVMHHDQPQHQRWLSLPTSLGDVRVRWNWKDPSAKPTASRCLRATTTSTTFAANWPSSPSTRSIASSFSWPDASPNASYHGLPFPYAAWFARPLRRKGFFQRIGASRFHTTAVTCEHHVPGDLPPSRQCLLHLRPHR